MKVFCDTSVLVAASIRQHPHYVRARPVLEEVASGRVKGVMSTHSLAELYSALTLIPVLPRLQPSQVRDIIETNVRRHFEFVPLTSAMYEQAIALCVARGLPGAKVYDALLLECARQVAVDRIYTFNLQDFRRLAPDLEARIAAP